MRNWLTPLAKKLNQRPSLKTQGSPRVPRVQIAAPLLPLYQGASEGERRLATYLQKKGIPFSVQVSYAHGRDQPGGAVVDFIIPSHKLAVRVQSVYFHNKEGVPVRDDLEKLMLMLKGLQVRDIWEDAIKRDVDQAWRESVGVLL